MTPAEVLARHTAIDGATMEPVPDDPTKMRPVRWCNECKGFMHWPCDAVDQARQLQEATERVFDGLVAMYGVGVLPDGTDDSAAAILGEHGLFVPDVTAHEPGIVGDADGAGWHLWCRCGWDGEREMGSYFDHLNP